MPHDDASLSTATPGLTVVERRVLDRIFQHPLSHNLSWREVLELFRAVGTVDHAHNGHLVLKLGAAHLTFDTARGASLGADEVMALRRFLKAAGWTPEHAPAAAPFDGADDVALVIDHAGAQVYPLEPDAGAIPDARHHMRHDKLRVPHDADRNETYPEDLHFFEAVATALAGQGRIIVISHGKGQSNEADHLMAYLDHHHRPVHARIARQLVADLPHTTVPQLLALARHALQAVSTLPTD